MTRRAAELVTPPSEVTPETYYTSSGKFYAGTNSGWADITSSKPTIQVAVDGSEIYIQGLAYWFPEAWIKGTIDGTTATFTSGQFIGEDQTGSEYIVGSDDYESTCDIVFSFDGTQGILAASTTAIIENGSADGIDPYCYWVSPTFTKEQPAAPEVVVLPEGAEVSAYAMAYKTSDGKDAGKPVNVAVVGNDVYFQGLSEYLPEAWVKGVKDGNTVTFAAMQYMGEYGSYGSSYAFYNGEAVFTYDATADSYSATGTIFGVLADQYYDGNYTDPVLTKVVEIAAMPANPTITALTNGNYGYYISFNIPIVDVNGNNLLTSKLSYEFFVDVEKEVSPLTFTPETHSKLTESLTVIPYGFTEDYDFYSDAIYLNDLYSSDWNKIGIKSIYTGGDETNETEIQWYTIKKYAYEQAYDDLSAEIATAETLVNTDTYTVGKDALNSAILSAKNVFETEGSTTDQLNAATLALKEAEATFKALNTAYNKLAAEIATAEALKTETMTQGLEDFNNAIGAAQAVLTNAEATAEDLNAAYTTLKEAEQAFIVANRDSNFAEATWVSSEQGYENAQVISEFSIDANITGIASKGTGSNDPAYYTNGASLRLYSNNTLTIAAGDAVAKITKIEITFTGATYATNFSAETEGYTLTGSVGTWEGEATSVTFSRTQTTSGHNRIKSIHVEYIIKGGDDPQTGDLTSGTYYTVGGKFYAYGQSDYIDATSYMPSVEVTVEGTTVTIAGLAYYFKDGSITGTMEGNTITFANGQLVGSEGESYDYIVGSDDGQSVCDIVFTYDPETKSLTSKTTYIAESNSADEVMAYSFWLNAVFSAEQPAAPEVVVLPEGAEVSAYAMAYKNRDGQDAGKPINVAVVGNDVYFQGMSEYLPKAWVKGVKDGNTVTFAADQYMGEYGTYGSSYAFYSTEAVFTYDAATESYSATGTIFGVLADQYYDGYYTNPVLTKVNEVAGVPATPSITAIESTQYGDMMTFNVPIVDVNGNNMVTSKLSYQFFIDDENTPMVFTTDYFTKLTENMTVLPYGFTENYDIYADAIYLNMPHDTWKKIGIQSIYAGGGEENKSAIFWFDVPEKELPVEAPEGLVTEAYLFNSIALEYSYEGDSEPAPYSIQVQVGFDGDDAYIQGLSSDCPELWVKATKNAEGKYVIPANQYMGELDFWGYTFPYYWTAIDEEENFIDAVFDFNAETNTFSSNQTLALNGSATELDYYMLFNDVTITKITEVAATPADPIFEEYDFEQEVGYNYLYLSIPAVDVDGNDLVSNKLFYTIWIEKNGEKMPYTFTATLYGDDFDEDVVEVPYNHNGYDVYRGGEQIYIEEQPSELATWTKVGVQSIYYGAGERRVSNIVWSDGTKDATGISSIAAGQKVPATIYNLSGQRVQTLKKGGLYIVNGNKVVIK
jgi:uncharacterized OB-fold protein